MDSQSQYVNIGDDDNDLEVLESVTPNDSVNCDSENSKKKAKTTTSKVWDNFSKFSQNKVKCNGCGKEYAWSGSNYGTSTLKRHMDVCTKLSKYKDVGGMLLDHEGKLRSRKIDQKHLRELISMAIISHDLPFSYVEYKWVREINKYLNPDVKHISRLTATTDIWKFYLAQKEKLKQVMHKSSGRICLTSDCWTSCTSEGYICLTAHFVDENWKLNSKILSFCKMEPPHSGFELAKKVYDCLKNWGIDRKVFSITLDNASANDNMQDILKEKLSLQDSLLCDGQFFHVRCCAHILNLIVQEGLKVVGGALDKIRESIKYVKASEGRMKSFHECVSQVGGINTKIGLRLDVSTRWNSTYTMLESAIRYRRAFSSLQLIDRNYKFAPTNEEWSRGEKMCEFLRPFNVITNLISGTSYPTSNLYFMQVWKIECLLKAYVDSEDSIIKDMAMRMKVKFDKYWTDYSVVLAFGVVLDPRMKLSMIKYCYSQLDSNTCQEKIDNIKSKLYLLFDQYSKWMSSDKPSGSGFRSSNCSVATITDEDQNEIEDSGLFDAVKDFMNQPGFDDHNEKCQLDIYLDETPLELKYYQNMDVLEFWKNKKNRYPELSIMASDILSIPITTVASESAFSIGARVLNKYRSSLLGDHVQALICTRNWLHGFINDDEELEDDASTLSKEGSNVVEDNDN